LSGGAKTPLGPDQVNVLLLSQIVKLLSSIPDSHLLTRLSRTRWLRRGRDTQMNTFTRLWQEGVLNSPMPKGLFTWFPGFRILIPSTHRRLVVELLQTTLRVICQDHRKMTATELEANDTPVENVILQGIRPALMWKRLSEILYGKHLCGNLQGIHRNRNK
jgi:hypothetical protein